MKDKKELEIYFEYLNISTEEAEKKLFNALSMLINYGEIYEKKDNLQPVLSD